MAIHSHGGPCVRFPFWHSFETKKEIPLGGGGEVGSVSRPTSPHPTKHT